MRKIEIAHGDKSITLSESNAIIGMRRKLLREQAHAGADFAEQLISLMLYPDVIAATVDQTGFDNWPVSREQFSTELPEDFVNALEDAVYSLNPHWLPDSDKETVKKKEKVTPIG